MAVTMPRQFEVQTQAGPDGVVLAVVGEVDMATAPELEVALDAALQGGAPVVVDLGACDFLDSSGLHVLERAGIAGGGVEVRCPRRRPAARALVLAGFPLRLTG